MTRSQVRFLLGTPMVPDAFDDDRWDYYYFFSSRTLQTAAQAPAHRVLRGRKSCALRKSGRADAGRSRPARARSASKAHAPTSEEEASGSDGSDTTQPPTERLPPASGSNVDAGGRENRRIRCRLPSRCPRPPGLLRVRPERPIDLDAIAVARHRVAIAQLAENSHVAHPTARRCCPPARARAPAPSPTVSVDPPASPPEPLALGRGIDHGAVLHRV